MRVRTEDRRRAILEAATEVFREVGYERASMAEISARVGGSKTTLYGYFPSKEELFAAAMTDALEDQGERALELLDASDPDVAGVLRRFGEAFHRLVMSPEALALTRTALAEGVNTELGPVLYAKGPKRILDALADYLSKLQKLSLIRRGDPYVAAAHLEGLLNAGIHIPLLFGAKPAFKSKDAVRAAVDTFLIAYVVA